MSRTFGELARTVESFLKRHLRDLENAERVEALSWYCQGLGLELPGKTVFGIAARLDPENIESCRQRMQRAVQKSRFSHEDVFRRLQTSVFHAASKKMRAYAVDDTGIAKQGIHSVGVQRQYSGTLGKIGNCQVVVTIDAISNDFGACLGAELYLPESWVDDETRLDRSVVPEEKRILRTKPEIALDLLRAAHRNGAPARPVLADAAYGDSRDFRDGIRALGWHYVVAISSNTTVWPPGSRPGKPKGSGVGRQPSQDQDPQGRQPIRIDKLANQLWEQGKFQTVIWRDGTKGALQAEFCRVRLQSAEGRTKNRSASEPLWLLIERDETQGSDFKYYFSSFPNSTSLKKLVYVAKMRWRIERNYQDMKQKLGFDKYEGRTWGGLHRHLAMVALIHAFLSLYREDFSPGGEDESVDLGRLSPCATCGAHALDRPLHHVPKAV